MPPWVAISQVGSWSDTQTPLKHYLMQLILGNTLRSYADVIYFLIPSVLHKGNRSCANSKLHRWLPSQWNEKHRGHWETVRWHSIHHFILFILVPKYPTDISQQCIILFNNRCRIFNVLLMRTEVSQQEHTGNRLKVKWEEWIYSLIIFTYA